MGAFLPLLIGIVLWAGFLFAAPAEDPQIDIFRIVALAVLVVTPLGVGLSRTPEGSRTNLFSAAVYLLPFAALVTAASFLVPAGVLAGTLAIAWLPATGMPALDAFNRLWKRGIRPIEELAVDAGALFLPVGAFWLWASRMGLEPFGFQEPIVLLTAVHFHYAGFGGPLLAGLTGRYLRSREMDFPFLYQPSAVLVLVGPVLVAAGFFLTPNVEALAAALLAAGYLGLALVVLFGVLRSLDSLLPRLLLAASAVSIVLAMAVATAYAVGNAGRIFFIPIETMVLVHGWLNAVGFCGLGLLGWLVLRRSEAGDQ